MNESSASCWHNERKPNVRTENSCVKDNKGDLKLTARASIKQSDLKTFRGAPGFEMYEFAKKLFPICRSITGDGVRETLGLIQEELNHPAIAMRLTEIPSGTKCFDWTVPNEWNIKDAYILDETGRKIVDFQKNNLHVVGYSTPIDQECSLEELLPHIFSLPNQPDAIPYITSYYREFWGFCLTDEQRRSLKPQRYRVVIDSSLKPGSLSYLEIKIPGESTQEIFLSTYHCHPSMGNNETSGMVVATFLAKWLSKLPRRRFSYRIVFVPETIGSIVYTSKHLAELKKNVIAGFQITCVGDNNAYSFLPSRLGGTLADRVAQHVLTHQAPDYVSYSFLDRGSDERQYCSPGVDLPLVSIMRSKYGVYPEYHTSLDNLKFISSEGLSGAWLAYTKCIEALENNYRYKVTCLCEPQLGKRGLYPNLSTKESTLIVQDMMNTIAYCDGNHDLLEIAEKIGVSVQTLIPIAERLFKEGLLERQNPDCP